MPRLSARAVAASSERIILNAGGRICESLPILVVDRKSLRTVDEVRARAMVLGALVQFGHKVAPARQVLRWLRRHEVMHALTLGERRVLESVRPRVGDRTRFTWLAEALASLLWAGRLIDALDFTAFAPQSMPSLLPRVDDDEGVLARLRLRPYDELFRALDLHYRLHWYAVDARLHGYSSESVHAAVIVERRHALEWLLDSSQEWDDVVLDT